MSAYGFADNLTPLVEAVMFFMLFEAFLSRRDKLKTWHYIAGVIALAGMISVSNHFFLYDLENGIGMIACAACISVCFYTGRFIHRLMIAALGMAIIGVTEIAVLYFVAGIFQTDAYDVIAIPEYRALGIFVSKLAGLAVCNVIRVKWNRQRHLVGSAYWLLFCLLFFSAVLIVFLIFRLAYESNTSEYNLYAFLGSSGLLFSTFFALYLYEHLAQQSEEIRVREQYERDMRSQLKHLDDIVARQNELRRFKHDLANQFTVLRDYFERRDHESGARYLDTLDQRFGIGVQVLDTGNSALDAIVSTKQTLAESKGIAFQANIQIAEHFPIEPVDACMIFGNALDNAIEACERLDGGEKHITLTLIQQDETLFCKIVNSAPPGQHHDLQTSKRDKDAHGLGLLNIKDALARYDVEPTITWAEGTFSLQFLIDLS